MTAWKTILKPTAMAAAALLSASLATAQSVELSGAEGGNLWFIELIGKSVSAGATLSAVLAEKAQFRAAAAAAGVSFTERRSFNTLFNGYSVVVTPAQRAQLAKVAGVRALYPVEVIQAPDPIPGDSGSPELALALSLTGANVAQNSLGLTGGGVRVGIIDSGIDIDHPAFSGTGVRGTTPFPNARVTHGYDLVGENFTGSNLPIPDSDPRDCVGTGNAAGHGTHVAGIVGANGGGIKGVAPGVSLGAYRVFGCDGSTNADIMIEAMERALVDGMQVINMSIGAARQWPQYPTSVAASQLTKKGVVVVVSAGNNGPGGSSPDALYAGGAPSVGDGVIATASFNNAQRSFTSNNAPYGFNAVSPSPLPPTSGTFPMAITGALNQPTLGTTAVDACTFASTPVLTGQVALIRRGSCGFHVKALNAQDRGALAVVLYDHSPGLVSATVAGSPAITIPVVVLTAAQGTALHNAIVDGPTSLTWTGSGVSYPFGVGGLISGFSSFGLAPDLSFKPNVGAPGGSILSSYPLQLGASATLSGTSMAAPHAAGIAALILEAVPTSALGQTGPIVSRNSPPLINMQTRMMNTAKPKLLSTAPASGQIDHAFRQGAGMLDVVAAVQTKQFVVPSSIAAGESQAGSTMRQLTIRNDSSAAVTYAMGHTAGAHAGPNTASGSVWVPGAIATAPASVVFSSPTVVVPANGMATVNVTIAAPAGTPNLGLYGGYVTLTPTGLGTPLHVPYAGLKGDYQETIVLRAGGSGFPLLARANPPGGAGSYLTCPAGCSYTMANSDNIPYMLISLAHQSRTLRLEAFDQASGVTRGVISEDQYVGRNSGPNGFFAFAWDGVTTLGVQPNGTYFIRVSALKALGNAANPADWEVKNSTTATIARP